MTAPLHITITHRIELAPETRAVLDELVSTMVDSVVRALVAHAAPGLAARVFPQPPLAAKSDEIRQDSPAPPAVSPAAAAPPAPITAPPPPSAAPITAVFPQPPKPGVPFSKPVTAPARPPVQVAAPAAHQTPPAAAKVAQASATVADADLTGFRLNTAARDEVIREKFPAMGASDALLALLNDLPGRPFEKPQQAYARAAQLGVRRAPTSQAISAAAVAERRRQDAEIEAQRATMKRPAPATALMPTNSRLTPERVDVLTREWPAGTSVNAIDRMLRELPGGHIPFEQIARYADSLGLRRPAGPRLDTAHREMAPIATEAATETVDWPAARQWVAANKIELPPGTTLRAARLIINDARAKMHLPAWNIVEARGVVTPLPAPTVGGSVHAP